MRQPSTPADRWAWWEAAITGERVPVYEEEPQAGFYAVRKFRHVDWPGGPLLPARIWWEPGEIDPDTGELLSDERCLAEIDGKPVDPWRTWTWMARKPIPESEFRWLKALSPLTGKRPPKRPR